MQYAITFLEGIIAFVSPCFLPMLPVYLSYFAGGVGQDAKIAVRRALGFILGFTAVFVALGAISGLVGGLLRRYSLIVNIVTGAIVVLFGLNYIGVFDIRFLNKTGTGEAGKVTGFFSAMLFGLVFSISWTPCVGMFLGSALMLASQQGTAIKGILLLLCFSIGLGLPFMLSAMLIERLKSALDWIKKRYKTINLISGLFLVAMGILMMTGMLYRFFDFMTSQVN
ncbi:MAG: cytochrome c biogenesis protein CcdA [Oscillospiraceae bacterium]|nr:cytochrome c biogenesis protein CcdA [Oscillospiraceae bacterium]